MPRMHSYIANNYLSLICRCSFNFSLFQRGAVFNFSLMLQLLSCLTSLLFSWMWTKKKRLVESLCPVLISHIRKRALELLEIM